MSKGMFSDDAAHMLWVLIRCPLEKASNEYNLSICEEKEVLYGYPAYSE